MFTVQPLCLSALTPVMSRPYCGGTETVIRWMLILAGALAAYLTYFQ